MIPRIRNPSARLTSSRLLIQRPSKRFQHTTPEQTPPQPAAAQSSPQPPTQPLPPQTRAPTAAEYQVELARRAQLKGKTLINLQPKTAKEKKSDAGIGLAALVSLVALPFIGYFYYEHRKQHMYEKKVQMLGEAQERYRRATG